MDIQNLYRAIQNNLAFIVGGLVLCLLITGALIFLKPEKEKIPQLSGIGLIPTLETAMERDQALKERILFLCQKPAMELFTDIDTVNDHVAIILFGWAGVDFENPPQQKEQGLNPFVEFFLRKAYVVPDNQPISNNPMLGQDPWPRLFNHFKSRLLSQCGADSVFTGPVSYTSFNDYLRIEGDISPEFINRFNNFLGNQPNPRPFTLNFLAFINATKGLNTLNTDEKALIESLPQQ